VSIKLGSMTSPYTIESRWCTSTSTWGACARHLSQKYMKSTSMSKLRSRVSILTI
jgi:hypothetical protein